MNKTLNFFLIIIFITGCSLNKNSKFWTSSQKIQEENILKFQEILAKEDALGKEFNSNKLINIGSFPKKNFKTRNDFNNDGKVDFDKLVKKSSRYKFSKIKNFHQFEPSILFNEKDIIFFDNKGSILKFDKNSKLIWKKNYYSKSEKKLNIF